MSGSIQSKHDVVAVLRDLGKRLYKLEHTAVKGTPIIPIFSGAGKTRVIDADFPARTPIDGMMAVAVNTSTGATYLCIRAGSTPWFGVQIT
jgi:hypothetical protein